MLARLALGALLVGLAAPVASQSAPVSAPKPQPTNPFNLDPVTPPPGTPLPVIGGTRAKPVCRALRTAVAPAIQAAMKTDTTYSGLRKRVYDYIARDTEAAKDLHLMQMDHEVDGMVKTVDALEQALKSPALDIPGTAKPEDAKTLRSLRASLGGILDAQKVELNAMSGFVETERMRRFGELTEGEQNMQRAVAGTLGPGSPTPPPLGAFLRDHNATFDPTSYRAPNSMHDARLLDDDLNDIAALTTKYEDAATRVVVPAAAACK